MTEKKRSRPQGQRETRSAAGLRATVRLKRSTYQPTKAELEEEVQIPTTPERLAKALGKQVNIEHDDD
ncbi:MAG: hypothetical protein F4Z29_06675 [Gemmatimonadetes bacterium]|nr:hypothetical protein [Gemmatimonadota bacterium]